MKEATLTWFTLFSKIGSFSYENSRKIKRSNAPDLARSDPGLMFLWIRDTHSDTKHALLLLFNA